MDINTNSNRRGGTGNGLGVDIDQSYNFASGFEQFLNLLFGRSGSVLGNIGNTIGNAFGNTGGSLLNGLFKGLGIDSNFGEVLNSLLNRWAGTGLTPADYQSAELQRYLRKTEYGDVVQSMIDAGLNPAMLYNKGGGASTPSLSLPNSGMSFSELMELPLLQAQIDNIKADTESKLSMAGLNRQRTLTEEEETRIRGIAADYGIEMTEAELGRYLADIEVKYADMDYKKSMTDLVTSQKVAQDITNDYLPRRFDAELKELSSRSESESASAKLSLASKAFTDIQANYARANGFLLSSNDALLVCTYLASLVGLDKSSVQDVIDKGIDGLKSVFKPKNKDSWRNSDGTYKRKNVIPQPSDFYQRR